MILENEAGSLDAPLRERASGSASRDDGDLRRLINELEVHHIELELQNEELRQARSQLEANYNELYDFAPVGYFTLERSGEIAKANLTGAELLGRTRSQILGWRLQFYLAPDSQDPFTEFLARVFGGEGRQSCLVTLMKGNSQTPVAAYIEAAGVGTGSACQAVMVDVSSAEQAKLQLRESEQRLRLALAASGMGVWEWHRDSGEIYWSPECFKIFGVDVFCPTLADVAALVHPEDSARVVAEARRALDDGKVHALEYRIIRRGGEVAWISTFAQARCDAGGKPLRLIGTAQDITERKRAEKNAAK